MDDVSSAPTFQIAPQEVVAVEHPMIIKNIDKGLKTFGNGQAFERIFNVDESDGSLPLYMRPNDPMCTPVISQNVSTNNILLMITVPKRIRKRKRGSHDSYSNIFPDLQRTEISGVVESDSLCSHSRHDSPALLLRTLKDNINNYKVNAIAEIERTHRFRGLTDFHHSTTHGEFSSKFHDLVVPGEVEKMRQFRFNLSRGWKKNEELLPPPTLTTQTLPFNWGWHQNPQITETIDEKTGEIALINRSKSRKSGMHYLAADVHSIPQHPPFKIPDDRLVRDVVAKLTGAFNERPVWTRRALANQLRHEKLSIPFTKALPYVAYQFKGGPFRDALIKYGVDPRTDKMYRIYQTLFFKAIDTEEKGHLKLWKDSRKEVAASQNAIKEISTHIFDGKTLTLDGKVWQMCDITDPLLVRLINNASLREECHKSNGYFNNGSWAKIHAVMKTKIVALQAHLNVSKLNFEAAINFPDVIDGNERGRNRISIPVPQLRLADPGTRQITGGGEDTSFNQQSAIMKRRGNPRNIRISRKLDAAQKQNHIKNPPPHRDTSRGKDDAETMPIGDGENTPQGKMEASGISTPERATASDDIQVRTRNVLSAEYSTLDESMEGGVEDDGDLEEDLEHDNSEDNDDSEDEDSGDIESGSGDEVESGYEDD